MSDYITQLTNCFAIDSYRFRSYIFWRQMKEKTSERKWAVWCSQTHKEFKKSLFAHISPQMTRYFIDFFGIDTEYQKML